LIRLKMYLNSVFIAEVMSFLPLQTHKREIFVCWLRFYLFFEFLCLVIHIDKVKNVFKFCLYCRSYYESAYTKCTRNQSFLQVCKIFFITHIQQYSRTPLSILKIFFRILDLSKR
jgi:hypothetical protein